VLLTLAAIATAFIPDLLDAAPPTLIMLDAPAAPSAMEVEDLRTAASVEAASAADDTESTHDTQPSAVSDVSAVSVSEPNDSSTNTSSSTVSTNSSTSSTTTVAPQGMPRPSLGIDETGAPPADSALADAAADDADAPAPALLVSTVGDSSMMFMNAGLAAALGPERWQPVPTEYARWTDGTGGFDRHGCGPTGDSLRIYFSQSVGPLEPRFNHPDDVEQTCDWRRWIPGGLELAQPDVVIASWGPTTMWGWERDGQMVDLTDPVIRVAVADAYAEVRKAMIAAGVQHVIWVAYPAIVWRPYFERNREEQPWSRTAVADELFELLTELGDPVVDLRDMNDPADFGDGLHFTETASARAAQRILAALPDSD